MPEPVEEKPALILTSVPTPPPAEPKPEFIKINTVPEAPEEPAAPAPAPAAPKPALKPVTHAPHRIPTTTTPAPRPAPIKFASPAPRAPRTPEIVHIAESVPGYTPFKNVPPQSQVGLKLKRNRN